METKSNAAGPDILNPGPATAEREAELEAGLEGDAFSFDISTKEGASIAVRPAATMIILQAILRLIPIAILVGQVTSDSSLGYNWPIFGLLIAECIGLFVLSVFMFRGSFSAMLIAAIYAGYLWLVKILALLESNIPGLGSGIIWLVILTATLGFGLPAAYRLMTGKFDTEAPKEATRSERGS